MSEILTSLVVLAVSAVSFIANRHPEIYEKVLFAKLLQALRGKIVHARPFRKPYRSAHKSNEAAKFPKHWLQQEASPKRIRDHIQNLEKLAIIVHSAIQKSEFKNVIFGAHPFPGLLGLGSHTVNKYG